MPTLVPPAVRSRHRRDPADELLLLAGRADPGVVRAPAAALAPGASWSRLVRQANRNAMVPMVFRALQAWDLGADGPGDTVLDELRTVTMLVARRNRVLAAEQARLLGSLATVGLHPLPFKGPDLAVRAYGDLGLRQFTDVDLVVPQGELDAAHAHLTGLGYVMAPGHSRRATTFSMVGTEHRVAVDVAAQVAHLPATWLYDATVTSELAGVTVEAVAPAPLFVALCVHGGKHYWESLQWVVDVARAHALLGPGDAEAALELADGLGVRRWVLAGTAAAHQLFGAPVDGLLLDQARHDGAVRRAVALVDQGAFAPRSPARLVLRRTAYGVAIAEGLPAKGAAVTARVRTQVAQRRRRRAQETP